MLVATAPTTGVAGARSFALDANDAGAFSAGIALALVLPLLGTRRAREVFQRSQRAKARIQTGPDKGNGMKRKPSIKSIDTVTLDEAKAYIEFSGGDELNAAWLLATDRNRLDGSPATPDDAEVHHALFLLCRARGLEAPSFDEMRVRLRARVAA